jgi:DNA primase
MLMHANGWVYCRDRHALIMPVLNYLAEPKGLCVRFLEPNARQRYDLQLDTDWYKLHYPVQKHKTKQVVLVEDTISAARVSLKTPAAALLGTYLGEEAALDLRQHYDKLVVCLDRDTWNKPTATGVKLKHEYDILFNSIKVKHISKDPKYMTDEELEQQVM